MDGRIQESVRRLILGRIDPDAPDAAKDMIDAQVRGGCRLEVVFPRQSDLFWLPPCDLGEIMVAVYLFLWQERLLPPGDIDDGGFDAECVDWSEGQNPGCLFVRWIINEDALSEWETRKER